MRAGRLLTIRGPWAARDATRIMLWTCFGLVVLGILVAGAVALLGGFRFPALDLEHFLAGQGPGWESPPLLARLRPIALGCLPADRRATARGSDQPRRRLTT